MRMLWGGGSEGQISLVPSFRASLSGWGKVVWWWWTWRDEYRGGDLPHPPLYTQTPAIESREEREEDAQGGRQRIVKGHLHVTSFSDDKDENIAVTRPSHADLTCEEAEVSPVRSAYGEAEKKIIALTDQRKKQGNTLGGVVEVAATGLPPGLGSFVQWDRRLDGRLGSALLSLQSAKEVAVG